MVKLTKKYYISVKGEVDNETLYLSKFKKNGQLMQTIFNDVGKAYNVANFIYCHAGLVKSEISKGIKIRKDK